MKKTMSLLKATMSYNMNLFRYKSKNKKMKKVFPIFIAFILFFTIWSYANMIMEQLIPLHIEIVLLTLFSVITSILTLIEGIYKAGNLLFNCKDDNMLLSLPIKKSTVLFVRIFKFYLFELMYNSLFLVPSMLVYARYVSVDITYLLACIVAILVLPIVPVVISCIIGGITSVSSSKFKYKNIAQIIFVFMFLLVVLYASFNLQNMMNNLASHGDTFNQIAVKIYFPVGMFINLVTNYQITNLLLYVGIHIMLALVTVFALSKVYYKINSKTKVVKTKTSSGEYKIKNNKPVISLIKKELKKFISSPVFVINAGFGLVLYIVACIALVIKFEGIVDLITKQGIPISVEQIQSYITVFVFGLIVFASLTTSITSSMISLEGKSFNILKSSPIKPVTIINSKVLTAIIIMLPFIFLGDIVLFARFSFSVLQIVLILLASIILPLVSETIGIIINLKYPRMDAENDTEVVKQSTSSMVSVFTGMILIALTIFSLFKLIQLDMLIDLILIIELTAFSIIYLGLLIYMNKKSVKDFNLINV